MAKLIKFEDIGDENACDNLTKDERKQFNILKEKVIEVMKKVVDHYKNKRYRYAVKAGQTAIKNLELCKLADDLEQAEQQNLLKELYSLLSDCYLKLEDWKKVCLMVNELRARWPASISRNVNILVNEAIALSNIEDDSKRAIAKLKEAQKIDPHNERVNRTLSDILAKEKKYKEERDQMWRRALELQAKTEK